MKKNLILFSLSILLLGGCNQSKGIDPHLIQTMVPIKFDQIGFNGYVPYQIMHFEALKKEKQKCDIDLDRNFETHVCHDLTGYVAEYHIPERQLKFGERTVCGTGYEYGPSRILFSQRNSAFYLTGNTLISLSLKIEKMYNRPDTYDETVWTSHFFRKEPKDERFDAEGLKRSSYIQYVPFEKGETMQSTIQGLQGEGQLFEKIACSYMMSVPDGGICYVGPHGVNVNGELNGQMMTYIFHPREPFYYKYFFLGGNSQCEGYGFGNVTFFE